MLRACAAHPRSACEAGMGLCARCIPCGSRVVTTFLKWRVGTPQRFEHGPTSLVSEPQAQALPSLPGMEGALVARTCLRRPRPVSRGCWPRSDPCHRDIRSAITWKRPGAEPRKKTPRAGRGVCIRRLRALRPCDGGGSRARRGRAPEEPSCPAPVPARSRSKYEWRCLLTSGRRTPLSL